MTDFSLNKVMTFNDIFNILNCMIILCNIILYYNTTKDSLIGTYSLLVPTKGNAIKTSYKSTPTTKL